MRHTGWLIPSLLFALTTAGAAKEPAGLPDFSRAGYHAGAKALPEHAPTIDITDFGAKGDGVTDAGEALDRAPNLHLHQRKKRQDREK